MVNANPFTNAFVAFVVIVIVAGILIGGLASDIDLANFIHDSAEADQAQAETASPSGQSEEYLEQEREAQADIVAAETEIQLLLIEAEAKNQQTLLEVQTEAQIQIIQEKKVAEVERIKESNRLEREKNNQRIEARKLWDETLTSIARYFGLALSLVVSYGLARTIHIIARKSDQRQKKITNTASLLYRIPAYRTKKRMQARARELQEITNQYPKMKDPPTPKGNGNPPRQRRTVRDWMLKIS